MTGPSPGGEDVTDVLERVRKGDPEAMGVLMPRVYDELRKIAHRHLRSERAGHTLSTTGLVHEAYLRLVDQQRTEWVDRAHFFAVAARMMRRILIDYARRHRALRRGGPHKQAISLDAPEVDNVALAENDAEVGAHAEWLLALDEALNRLKDANERLARIVECRFFGGLTERETAAALGVSQRTVAREWSMARGWLYRELRRDVA